MPDGAEEWISQNCALRELVSDGFDLAFSNELPDEHEGMGHAFMRPMYYLDPEYKLPMVPFSVNCYYGPQPTGKRCYQLGRAVRAASVRVSVKNLPVGPCESCG